MNRRSFLTGLASLVAAAGAGISAVILRSGSAAVAIPRVETDALDVRAVWYARARLAECRKWHQEADGQSRIDAQRAVAYWERVEWGARARLAA